MQVIVFSKRGKAKSPPTIYDSPLESVLAVGSLAAFTGAAAAARQFTESTDKSSEKQDEDSSKKRDEIERN